MIARRQYAEDLQPGIDFLDRYIAECATNARKRGAHLLPATGRR